MLRTVSLPEGSGQFLPLEPLNLCGFQIVVESLEQHSKFTALGNVVRKFFKAFYLGKCKELGYVRENGIELVHIAFQMIGEKGDRFVSGIILHRLGDVALHRMGLTIVTNHAERLVWPEEPIGARKRLDQTFVT